MENTNKSSKKLIVWSIIVFVFCLFLRLHFINLKQNFHCDELFSFNIINVNDTGWKDASKLPIEPVLTGKELKEKLLFNDGSVKETIKDLKSLHKNTYDSPHTNLYYSILRIWTTGHTSNQINDIKWRTCSLNLVFFTLSFFLMFKILRRLFKNEDLIPLGLLAAFANTGGISMTLFARPYELQTTIFLLLVYVVMNLCRDIEENKLLSKKNFFVATGALTLTALSGYFALLLIGMFGLVLLIKSIKRKQYKDIMFLVGCGATAILCSWLFYNGYFLAFTGHRATEIPTMTLVDKNNMNITFWSYLYTLCFFLFYIPCSALLSIAAIRNIYLAIKNKEKSTYEYLHPALIITIAVVWSYLTIFMAPFKILRYIAPVLPFFAIVYPLAIKNLSKIEQKIYTVLFSIIIIVYGLLPTSTESKDTHYPALPGILKDSANIENLMIIQNSFLPFAEHLEIPVYVWDFTCFTILETALRYDDEQKIHVSKNIELPKEKEAYIVMVRTPETLFYINELAKKYYIEFYAPPQRIISSYKLTKK